MHFTESQIEEISQRLAGKAIRDSELPDASSMSGSEYLVGLIEGGNKKISLSSLASALSSIESFVSSISNSLSNYYYLKLLVYNKTEVDNAIGEISGSVSQISDDLTSLGNSVYSKTEVDEALEGLGRRITAVSPIIVVGTYDPDEYTFTAVEYTTEELKDMFLEGKILICQNMENDSSEIVISYNDIWGELQTKYWKVVGTEDEVE